MRSNLEGARLAGNLICEKNKYLQVKQTLAGTYTMDDDMPHWHFLDPGGAGRTVLLPAEAKGLWYILVNLADNIEDLTVKEDSNTTTIGVVSAGQFVLFICDGTSWYAPSDVGISAGPVLIPDGTTYTVLKANSGKVHIVPDVTANITITLPTPDEGLSYVFIYGGVAADAQNHIFTGGAGNFLKGGVLHLDTDAGAGADELVTVYGNGSSHITLTHVTPGAGTRLEFYCDGALWYVNGNAVSVTVPVFS